VSEIGLKKADLDTPVLWVDLDIMERNIASLARHFKAAGVQWRPHTKGIKIPAIAHKAIAAGAIGVTCAKLGEAEVMAAAGIRDILIANQVVGPIKATRLANLCRHADVKVAVDSEANVAELGAAARAKGVEIGVVVEVDNGMTRAGVRPGEPAVALSRVVHETPGLQYRGVMGWEGHAAAIRDPAEKRPVVEKAVGMLVESATLCRDAGLPVTIVSAGGSKTYPITSTLAGITEIQAGGAIFSDVSYRDYGAETEPSLFVRTMVTSRPAPDRIIFDVGFKSLPTWHAMPMPVDLPGADSLSTSAEHGTVKLATPNTTVKVGDAFDFIVGYGDSTVFLYDQLYGLRDGSVEVVWDIQNRGKLR
jgi:D-serine deaminase-like pyridoxal phosphate-dependent protein